MEPPKMYWNAFVKGMDEHFAWTAQDTIFLIITLIVSLILVFIFYRRWRK